VKPIAFVSMVALLGACSTATPPAPTVSSIGNVLFTAVGGDGLEVIQNDTNHVLRTASISSHLVHNGVNIPNWASGSGTISGSGLFADDHLFAAGLDNGTYFAGINGSPNASIPSTGTASLTGLYAFVVNGSDASGPLALTANFRSGTITDTTAGISVNGTLWGNGITGTVDIDGETSALKAGFYTKPTGATYPNGYVVDGVALGANMAGVIRVK